MKYGFRYYKGVKYVAPGRCPFEHWHRAEKKPKRPRRAPEYKIEPESFSGEKLPKGATGRHVLSFRGNWLGTYRTKRAAMRARRDHRATRASQHELAQARIRDIDRGRA